MNDQAHIVSVFRKSHFNAAHRLHNPEWDDKTNQEVFDVCNNPNFHGHNYDLIVKVSGAVDPGTGYVMDLKVLHDIVDKHVIAKFDHKNLNLDLPDFQKLIPTSENISIVIWNILQPYINPAHQLSVRLFETERNYVEYNGPGPK